MDMKQSHPAIRTSWHKAAALALGVSLVMTLGACGAMQKADQIGGNNTTSADDCPVSVNKETQGTIRIAWQAIPNADLMAHVPSTLD